MVSSQGKTAANPARFTENISNAQNNLIQSFNEEKIFQLINNFLSFEACLYHQVLPLGVDKNHLWLGMVNPDDGAAVEYVCRIFCYLNLAVKTQPLEAATLRQILSSYLQSAKKSKETPPPPEGLIVTEKTSKANASEDTVPETIQLEPYGQTTFILDDTAALEMPLSDQPEIPVLPEPISSSPPQLINSSTSQKVNTQLAISAPVASVATLLEDVPALEIEPISTSLTAAELAQLPARQLLAHLLGQVLAAGIGRLYFERQQQQGRILWSENGVLQSVLERLPLNYFQELIDELKQLAGLSTESVTESKQRDIERRYHQGHLLLRLRIIPGITGEEATLQVLQGAALKFYQQKQLHRLSQEVLTISQHLGQKLQKLQNRLQRHPDLKERQIGTVAALSQVVEHLEEQLQVLGNELQNPQSSKFPQ
ncbi:MAG: pilus assembly protein PilB [Nostocaceae cyanobacterium]|nr:pilus assembly protein PilB [Nostocaceae cyanobacterium]